MTQPPPPSGYGHPPGYGYPPVWQPRPRTNATAVTAMVLSICGTALGICVGCAFAPAALLILPVATAGAITGHVALRQVRTRGEGGRGMALAGTIVGWSGTGLLVAALLAVATLIVLGMSGRLDG